MKTVTINHCYSLSKRRKRERGGFSEFERQAREGWDEANKEDLLERVPHLVNSLNNDVQKKAVFLWYIRGCTTREIASELKIPSSTVSSHVHRFRAFARTELLNGHV